MLQSKTTDENNEDIKKEKGTIQPTTDNIKIKQLCQCANVPISSKEIPKTIVAPILKPKIVAPILKPTLPLVVARIPKPTQIKHAPPKTTLIKSISSLARIPKPKTQATPPIPSIAPTKKKRRICSAIYWIDTIFIKICKICKRYWVTI